MRVYGRTISTVGRNNSLVRHPRPLHYNRPPSASGGREGVGGCGASCSCRGACSDGIRDSDREHPPRSHNSDSCWQSSPSMCSGVITPIVLPLRNMHCAVIHFMHFHSTHHEAAGGLSRYSGLSRYMDKSPPGNKRMAPGQNPVSMRMAVVYTILGYHQNLTIYLPRPLLLSLIIVHG